MKQCRTCQQVKPFTDFYKATLGNYQFECKQCALKRAKDKRSASQGLLYNANETRNIWYYKK